MAINGFESPNYTQAPNDFFELLALTGKGRMTEAEVRVMCVMIRNTFGYARSTMRMSIRKLAKSAGICAKSAWDGAEAAIARGLLRKETDGGVTIWTVVVADGGRKPEDRQGRTVIADSTPVIAGSTGVIAGSTPSIKESKKESKKERAPRPARSSGPDPRTSHPAIVAVKTVTGYYPSKTVYDEVIRRLGAAPNIEKLRCAVVAWNMAGNKATNIGGILDWYENGIPDRRNGNGAAPAPAATRALGRPGVKQYGGQR